MVISSPESIDNMVGFLFSHDVSTNDSPRHLVTCSVMHQQLFGQGAVSVAHDPSEFTHHLTFNQREQMSTHEHVTCA